MIKEPELQTTQRNNLQHICIQNMRNNASDINVNLNDTSTLCRVANTLGANHYSKQPTNKVKVNKQANKQTNKPTSQQKQPTNQQSKQTQS